MRHHVRLARPQRLARSVRYVRRIPTVSRTIARIPRPVLRRNTPLASRPALAATGFETDPYVDYGRWLTPEGGVLVIYKDLDLRLRHGLWRAFAWASSTGLEAWLLHGHSPVQSTWINVVSFLILAAVNLFIVWKSPELYRTVEIRPDCMILEGADVFWLSRMENGPPAFHPDEEGNQVLSGIYGTRFVEYFTVRRFDDYDRMPEVFAAHLQEAMLQLWAPALGLGAARPNSPPRQRR